MFISKQSLSGLLSICLKRTDTTNLSNEIHQFTQITNQRSDNVLIVSLSALLVMANWKHVFLLTEQWTAVCFNLMPQEGISYFFLSSFSSHDSLIFWKSSKKIFSSYLSRVFNSSRGINNRNTLKQELFLWWMLVYGILKYGNLLIFERKTF